MERTEITSGGSETITLVARFDMSTAPAISSLNLSRGVKIKYITTWETNAYNPQEYIQSISSSDLGTVSVNMASSSSIVSLQTRINTIYDLRSSNRH